MKTLIFLCALLCLAYGYKNKGETLCNFCLGFVGGIEKGLANGEQSIEKVSNL